MGTSIQEYISEYLDESKENLNLLSSELSALEKELNNYELINSIFRRIHTLKGSAAFLGFKKQEQFTHALENVLELIRDKSLKLSPGLIDLFFDCVKIEEEMLSKIQQTGTDEGVDEKDLVKKLNSFEKEAAIAVSETDCSFESKKDLIASVVEQISLNQPSYKNENTNDQMLQDSISDYSIRVKVDLLDNIMNLVGELVLIRNQFVQHNTSSESPAITRLTYQLNGITTELQEDVMATRMQPVASILVKYERMVREISRNSDKAIDLEILGAETELDKNLLESIKDPLSHIIRNACDHGIESENERHALGKSKKGKINIKSFYEGGQVVIEVSDDGRGIDKDSILKKAVELNFITAEEVVNYNDKSVYSFLFMPRFTTAKTITEVSGRGVGMDVVKTNVERIGGSVELDSQLNEGTTVVMRIPLTLAIIPALVAKSRGESFVFPQANLVELVRLDSDNKINSIERIYGSDFFRLRGELIPLFHLNDHLGILSDKKHVEDDKNSIINIIVMNSEGSIYGLVVDEIEETQEIVVKPLSKSLRKIKLFAGATILGCGDVALIFDSIGFYRSVVSDNIENTNRLSVDELSSDIDSRVARSSNDIVLFKANNLESYGLELSKVTRFETFTRDQIETVGNRLIVRYRDGVLPMINFEKSLSLDNSFQLDESISEITCIVVNSFGRNFGVPVKEITDILSMSEKIDDKISKVSGVKGVTYIDNHYITIVDIKELVLMQNFSFLSNDSMESTKSFFGKKILLLEDSKIYQKAEVDFFTSKGFEVSLVENGKDGLDLIESGENFDLIITDIEMPIMDGYKFVESIRRLEGYKSIPVIAISQRVEKKSVEKGLNLGINKYVEKFDGDMALEVIESITDWS